MSYINEILAFQGFAQDKSLSSGQIALWYALMYINNKCQWQEWFTVANKSLESNSGLTRQGIAYARNILKQHGLIDFKSRGTKSTLYKMIPISKSLQDTLQGSLPTSLQDTLQGSLQDTLQSSCTLNRQDKKRKDKNIIITPPISPSQKQNVDPEIELPLNDKSMYPIFSSDVEEWGKLYPAVDVKQQLRNMRGWLDANPTRRKTKNGIKGFINKWLMREQDKGKKPNNDGNHKPSFDISAFEGLGLNIPEIP